jgi:spore coat-associated protein N
MKKIIISLAIIVLVGSAVIGATSAYFSDTETSTGNTFTAGSLDLQIDEDPDGSVFSWVDDPSVPVMNNIAGLQDQINNMKPGDSGMIIVGIKNNGSIDGFANLGFKSVIDDENGIEEPEIAVTTGGDLSEAVDIVISYGDKSVIGDTWEAWDLVWSGKLSEWKALSTNVYAVPAIEPQEDDYWVVEFSIATTVGNEIMSDTVGFNVEFGLDQVVSGPDPS